MRLAIGDVVRVKSDQVLGTVVCVATHGGGSLVHLHTDGRGSRVVSPEAVERIGRGSMPMTTGRAPATLLCLVPGVAVAALFGVRLHSLGAGPLVTALAVVISLTTVSGFLINRFTRPRTVRL